MYLSTRLLGRHVAQQLQDRAAAPVLIIGRDAFTRADLSALECFNFGAAQNLSRILAEFAVRDTRDVFERIDPRDLAVPHLGAISLAVLGAAFEAKKLGGDHPLETWVTTHRASPSPRREFVTFSTMKAHHVLHSTRRSTRGTSRSVRRHSQGASKWHHQRTATAADGGRGRKSKK